MHDSFQFLSEAFLSLILSKLFNFHQETAVWPCCSTFSTRRIAETVHARYHDGTDNACALVEGCSNGNTRNPENRGVVRRNDVRVNEQEQSKCASSNGEDRGKVEKRKRQKEKMKRNHFPSRRHSHPGTTGETRSADP